MENDTLVFFDEDGNIYSIKVDTTYVQKTENDFIRIMYKEEKEEYVTAYDDGIHARPSKSNYSPNAFHLSRPETLFSSLSGFLSIWKFKT